MELRYIHTIDVLIDYLNIRDNIKNTSDVDLNNELDNIYKNRYTIEAINRRNEIEKELEFRYICNTINDAK